MIPIKPPFPWFGGKSRVADVVWKHFGSVPNYLEPFFGSGAVLLGRPGKEFGSESINDKDCLVSNFWRTAASDPERLAHFADWPVNEADLHARHTWLVKQLTGTKFAERMKTDPDYFDPKIAGYWVWGISQWIGDGFCAAPHHRGQTNAARSKQGIHRVSQNRPHLSDNGQGILRPDPKGLRSYFGSLYNRLQHVRVCCGDWKRILGPAVLCKGLTAVFLDPPYSVETRSDCYRDDSRELAKEVRDWAVENSNNPELRIALCGYEGEHTMPANWKVLHWKASGGYSGFAKQNLQGKENTHKERIWFSPYCIKASLF